MSGPRLGDAMADQGIKPVKGYVLVKLLESNKAQPMETPVPSESAEEPREGILAQVISAGPDVPAKAGQTIIMRSWVVSGGVKFSDMLFVEGYSIVAVVA